MKTFYVIILVLFFYNFTTAQEKLDSPLIEIFTLIEDSSPNPSGNYSYTLTPIGTAWKVIPYNIYLNDYDISNEVSGGTVYPIINIIYSGYTGFNYIAHGDHNYPEFGFGLYKLECSTGNYFYLDYRDTRYGKYTNCTGHCADIWVKYDVNSEEIRLASTAGGWSDAIPNRAYLKIWDIKGQGSQVVTERVDDFWINSLVLIPSQTGNNPKLVWGPHPDDNVYIDVTGYNIYRAINGGSFSKIAEVNNTTYTYTDEYFMIGGSAQAHYKVTASWQDAMKSIQETSPTNIVTVGVGLYKDPGYSVEQIDFQLDQNYPNPFNSNSVIKYSIPKSSQVTLKIFNSLGEEIETLINEEKIAGTYELNWSAANLPSGVYFYKLAAGDFVQTHKMILLR